MDFFYDKQIRRYIAQFLRIFSDVKFRTDPDENGFSLESRVPIKYGDMSRLVATILSSNTENLNVTIPQMSGYVVDLKPDSDRRYDPSLVQKVQASETYFDTATNQYTNKKGNSYTVEMFMPVPYKLTMKLDIITSNTDSKLQILEQLLTIFNPTLELQQNENPLDWTRVFQVQLTDTTWSNRTIPVGDSTDYDIASLQFEIPIWINPAAKEKRQRIIESIITRIFDSNDDIIDTQEPFNNNLGQINVTSENLKLKVEYNLLYTCYSAQLVEFSGRVNPDVNWVSKTRNVGAIIPNRSRIKLRLSDNLDDTSKDIYGLITEIDQNDPTILYFDLDQDALPDTIDQSPITAIIDPLHTYDGFGIDTNNISITHRYMVMTHDNNDPAIHPANQHWDGITAYSGDIIEHIGGQWYVVFDVSESESGVFLENLADGEHYQYDGESWVYTTRGVFNPAYWCIMDVQST